MLALSLAGCATGPAALPATKASPDPFAALKKNLAADEVKALVGAPAEVTPFNRDGFTGEIWIYRRKIAEVGREVPIRTQEVPLMNPLTGVMGTTNEPVYETQFEAVYETIELLMVEQQLIAWKSHRESGSEIRPR